MNQLPTVIQLEILNFLHHIDRLEYCRVNKLCFEELSAESRIITLRYRRGINEFIEDEGFRDSIIKKLKNPSKQLSLELYGKRIFPSFAINVKSLKTSTVLFQQFNLKESTIHKLSLSPSFLSHMIQTSLINDLQSLTGLKDLSISSIRAGEQELPIIPQLERLQVKACTLPPNISTLLTTEVMNLQCLKLVNCEGISDVSSLGSIYELHIITCQNITNITTLNNNQIIIIQSSTIEDYSQSFQYSRVIDLSFAGFNAWSKTRNLDMNRLQKVQRLRLDYLNASSMENLSISILPPTLRSLTLLNIPSGCSLPLEHSLKELILEYCSKFSLQNMSNIPFLSFSNCHQIEDWSLLKDTYSIKVKNCSNFNSLQLNNVKLLTVELSSEFIPIAYIFHITHLKLNKAISIYRESFFTKLIAASDTLQELELEVHSDFVLTKDGKLFLHSFQQLITIKKIIINIFIERYSKQFMEFYDQVKDLLGHAFSVDVSSTLSKVYLLRKQGNNHKTNNNKDKSCVLM